MAQQAAAGRGSYSRCVPQVSLWGEGRGRGRTRACDTLICVGGPGCLSLHGKFAFRIPGEQVRVLASGSARPTRDRPDTPPLHVACPDGHSDGHRVAARRVEITGDRVWALAAGWGMVRGAVARCQKLAATGPGAPPGGAATRRTTERTVARSVSERDTQTRTRPTPRTDAGRRYRTPARRRGSSLCRLSADSLWTLCGLSAECRARRGAVGPFDVPL